MFNNRFNYSFDNPEDQYDILGNYGPSMEVVIPQNNTEGGMIYSNGMPSADQVNNPYNTEGGIIYSNGMPSADQVNNPLINQYAEGGKVKKPKSPTKSKKRETHNPYPSLAEMIRQQGEGEDVILAHINPTEAEMLEVLSGGGKINPITGLPQYGFFNKPGKWLKSNLGGGGGAILGNLIFPGVGGILGGAVGQGLNNSLRGKNFMEGALKGALVGTAAPSVAGYLGSGLNSLGYQGVGNYLSKYGANNAIFPALGLAGAGKGVAAGSGADTASAVSGGQNESFADKLATKSKNFFSKPTNLLATAVAASSILNRPKEKTPEKRAAEEKRYNRSLLLTPAERAEREAAELANEQARRRIARDKFLPEERLGPIDPLYTKTHTPEEYKKYGKWLNYYDNPQFTGNPILFRKGGEVNMPNIFDEEIQYQAPRGLAFFLEGMGGGQDDDRRMDLPEGSYIIDATTTAHLGDGNNRAGQEKIKALVSDGETFISPEGVERIGRGDHKQGIKKLDLMVKNVRKHKGGSIKLPPKAKPASHYMRG